MEPLKVIIVDDEKRISSSLKTKLTLCYPDALTVAEAGDVNTAVTAINIHKPDVVLLDIKLGNNTGFDLLKLLMPVKFKVIFITAFNKYAELAFKFNAIDYLIKPVIPEELVKALNKARLQIQYENLNVQYNALLESVSNPTKKIETIILNSNDHMHVINVQEIIRCEADDNYTSFFMVHKSSAIMVSSPLAHYKKTLEPMGFQRVHHSHLVNLRHVASLKKKQNPLLIMTDNSVIPVSQRRYTDLVSALKRL